MSVVVLIVVGVLLWMVNRFIPMQGTIKSILNAVVVICRRSVATRYFGLFHTLSRIHVGRERQTNGKGMRYVSLNANNKPRLAINAVRMNSQQWRQCS
jgi:hypothetical protein